MMGIVPIYILEVVMMSGNEWLLVIVEKQDPKWVILVIWYGTLMLEYLLVE